MKGWLLDRKSAVCWCVVCWSVVTSGLLSKKAGNHCSKGTLMWGTPTKGTHRGKLWKNWVCFVEALSGGYSLRGQPGPQKLVLCVDTENKLLWNRRSSQCQLWHYEYCYSLILYLKAFVKPSSHIHLFFWNIFQFKSININMNPWTFLTQKF